jgi:hypothetical protein
LRLKTARGDLHTTVAIGYRRGTDDRLEQDPDLRIREALSLVFRKFGGVGASGRASRQWVCAYSGFWAAITSS